MELKEITEALQKNGMNAYALEKKEDVIPLLKTIIPKGAKVGSGGSVTLDECGITDFLKNGDYSYCYRGSMPNAEDVFKLEKQADYFLCSSNAITLDGCLYNVDGRSNRISAIAHGAKNVVIVAGRNKIVNDLDAAVLRVKTLCAPMNAQRLGYHTFCREKGECVSLRENPSKSPALYMTDGCKSDERICCNYLISAKQRLKGRITVILINESLGY